MLAWFLVAVGLPPLLFAFWFKLEVLGPEDKKWTTHVVVCRRWREFFVNFLVRNWGIHASVVLLLLGWQLKYAKPLPVGLVHIAWFWIALNGLCVVLAILLRLLEKPNLMVKPEEVKTP